MFQVIRGCFYIKTKECPKISPSVDDTILRQQVTKGFDVFPILTQLILTKCIPLKMTPEPFYRSTFTGNHRDILSWKMPIEFLT